MMARANPAGPAWLRYVLVLALLAGCAFRLYGLDHKVYGYDEIYTSLRVVGETEAHWIDRAATLRNAGELRGLLHPGTSATDIRATVARLAVEDPQHGPLYYIAAYYWLRVF